MMLALGAGSFTAGMFHLTTHAYFKALLFLAAGSVIHAVHTNDMREMGALRTNADNLRDFPAGYAGACRHPAVADFIPKMRCWPPRCGDPYLFAIGAMAAR